QDEREREARLAGRDRDDEEREHLPLQVAVLQGEGDEVERHPLQHHLGRQEQDDQVPAGQEADHAPDEQDRADREVVAERQDAALRSATMGRWTMAMAPTVAIRSSVPPS